MKTFFYVFLTVLSISSVSRAVDAPKEVKALEDKSILSVWI